MTFKATIDMGNAAFEDAGPGLELARILRELADAIEHGHTDGTVRDINGNRVGTFATTGKGRRR